jgi:hypothetical protein
MYQLKIRADLDSKFEKLAKKNKKQLEIILNQIADGHPTLKGRVCKGRPPISRVVRSHLDLVVQISLIDSIGTFSLVFPGNR